MADYGINNTWACIFSDKYRCEHTILKLYDYSKDNLAVIKARIDFRNKKDGLQLDYNSMREEEQKKFILEEFSHIKRAENLTDNKLVDGIRNNKIKLREYEYLRTISKYPKSINLLVRRDVVEMAGKKDWTIEDIKAVFIKRGKDIKERINLYLGNNLDEDAKEKQCDKIFKDLYSDDKYDDDGVPIQNNSLVNFISECISSNKEYLCPSFYNDKPLIIYQSEIDKIKEIDKRYHTNNKDGRRIVRLACLLLAWQKAYYNQYIGRLYEGYATFNIEQILKYNPIDYNGGDSSAMIVDFRKLKEGGYFERILPEVPAPRENTPICYYRMTFCVDPEKTDNESPVLEIADYEYIWEQIYLAAFGEIDLLVTPKEKEIKHGVIVKYDKKDKNGSVYIEDNDKTYPFTGNNTLEVGKTINIVIIDSKKKDVQWVKGNERVYMRYKAIKRCSKCGKMFFAKQKGDGTGQCDKCNNR